MNKTDKTKMCTIVYVTTIVLEIFAFLIRPNRYNMPDWAFYTVLANYVGLVSALFALIFQKNEKMKEAVAAFRFCAMIMLLITFLIVVLVLVWFTDPLTLLLDKNNFIHHIFAPLGTLISYYNFENRISKISMCIFPIAVSIIYSAIIIVCNIKGILDGPYPFFMTQRFGLPTVLIYTAGIAAAMTLLCIGAFRFRGLKK